MQKVDSLIAEIAARRHGAVARDQLLAAGVTRHMIDGRVMSGALIRVYHAVYLVAWAAGSPLAHASAALLACKPNAVLSHRTAARLWQLPVPPGGPIEVTVVGRERRSPQGVLVRSLSHLPASELRRMNGLPITSPSLTILDLAGALTAPHLAAVLNEARVLRIVTERQLRATLTQHRQRRGARSLRSLLEAERGPRITRSEAERRALRLMRAHGIEPDDSDVAIGPYRADFLFRRERLVVEVDGYRYHSTPSRFVDDRRRIADLGARGIQVFPLTWADVGDGAEEAMGRLNETLERRRELFGDPTFRTDAAGSGTDAESRRG